MSDTAIERPLPLLTDLDRPYWTSGADGRWRLQRCTSCRRHIHPPALRCPHDHGVPEYVALSGRGRVETWTVNNHRYFPAFAPPYVIAFVTPVEDGLVRVLTNVVNVNPDDMTAGMAVRVTFERDCVGDEELFIPLFEPDV